MKRAVAFAALAATAVQLAGCEKDAITADNVAESPVLRGCPAGLPGPAMVALPTPSGGTYCMDATPVTQGQYTEFLEKVLNTTDPSFYNKLIPNLPPGTIEIPDQCKGNRSLVPSGWHCEDTPYAFDWYGGHAEYSVGCIDWCDAYAYCAWAGKRLCGAFGGGAVALSESTDPEKAEWMWACTQGGKTVYPYGDVYESGRCPDAPDEASDSATRTCKGQVGPFSEVTNLVGGWGEWQNNCADTGAPDLTCGVHALFAANTSDPEAANRCDARVGVTLEQLAVEIGFRCCSD